MLSTKKNTPQSGLFYGLADQLDQKHPLYQLANKMNWPFFDDAFNQVFFDLPENLQANFIDRHYFFPDVGIFFFKPGVIFNVIQVRIQFWVRPIKETVVFRWWAI